MFITLTILSLFSDLFNSGPEISNERFEVSVEKDHAWIVKETATARQWRFTPDFVVITSEKDPGMAMRPAGIENVMYNVVTWKNVFGDASSLHHSDKAEGDQTRTLSGRQRHQHNHCHRMLTRRVRDTDTRGSGNSPPETAFPARS